MPRTILTTNLSRQIWDDHAAANPRNGNAFNEWVTATALKHEVSEKIVRTAIARETQAFRFQVDQKRATTAQHVAAQMGIDMVEVLRTLRGSLIATRREVLYEESVVPVEEPENYSEEHERNVTGEHGYEDTGIRKRSTARKRWLKLRQPMRRPDGTFEYFEQPDYKARLMATEQFIRIIGMEAPEQLEVNIEGNVNIRNLTQEQIYRELSATMQQLKSLGIAGLLEGVEGGGTGQESRQGPVILANGVHEDKGRTGPDGRSLQTVSPEAIHPPHPRGSRKRASPLPGKKQDDDGIVDCQRVGGVEDVYTPGDGSDIPVGG